ncbi:MAG TPA: glycosyltransferase [Candidatus Binatia bacterium]|nr:glycosyltransferase [Candidatus Binatia bacterium]
MYTVAYLANRFPVAVEPYVSAEICQLRQRGIRVVACTARRPEITARTAFDGEIVCLQNVSVAALLRSLALLLLHWPRISSLLSRVLCRGNESPLRRMKALFHTWLGAYFAALLEHRDIDHIHAHHGYFASWIALVAARLLGVEFSLTLHGSDVLLNGTYLDTKLHCARFCATVSDYNRRYLLCRYPQINAGKIIVSRMGVEIPAARVDRAGPEIKFKILAVGRLHSVKDHAFLVRACAQLQDNGVNFECSIAGEGPERQRLESLIRKHRLQSKVILLGHRNRSEIEKLYDSSDLIVLTSRSEGVPLVLMEAMARGRIVLAPEITGVPELVIPGKTGFLYTPGSLEDFLTKILYLRRLLALEDANCGSRLDWIRHAARIYVLHNFHARQNLSLFCDRFLNWLSRTESPIAQRSSPDEDLVLQQI